MLALVRIERRPRRLDVLEQHRFLVPMKEVVEMLVHVEQRQKARRRGFVLTVWVD